MTEPTARIDITPLGDQGYAVTVHDAGTTTSHRVRVPPAHPHQLIFIKCLHTKFDGHVIFFSIFVEQIIKGVRQTVGASADDKSNYIAVLQSCGDMATQLGNPRKCGGVGLKVNQKF